MHRGRPVDVAALNGNWRRIEEGAHVTADLHAATRVAQRSCESARLRAKGAALVMEERLEESCVGGIVLVGGAELEGALARVAVNEAAARAAHDVERRVLRERHPVRESLGRRAGAEARPVILPEQLHLMPDVVGVRDDRVVVGAADGAGGELERGHVRKQEAGTARKQETGTARR